MGLEEEKAAGVWLMLEDGNALVEERQLRPDLTTFQTRYMAHMDDGRAQV